MSDFAVAVLMMKKELGPYSRTIDEALEIFLVSADTENDAYKRGMEQAEIAYPRDNGWMYKKATILQVSLSEVVA